jgi:hypothetical protein
MQLVEYALVVLNALGTRHQMLVIKNHSLHSAYALLCPELLFLADFGGEPLMGQDGCCFITIKADLDCDINQHCIIR